MCSIFVVAIETPGTEERVACHHRRPRGCRNLLPSPRGSRGKCLHRGRGRGRAARGAQRPVPAPPAARPAPSPPRAAPTRAGPGKRGGGPRAGAPTSSLAARTHGPDRRGEERRGQRSPRVYSRCNSANTGKRERDSTHGVGPSGKKSGPRLTSLPTPCHFLLKLRFSSRREGRPGGRHMSHPFPCGRRSCQSQGQSPRGVSPSPRPDPVASLGRGGSSSLARHAPAPSACDLETVPTRLLLDSASTHPSVP